MYAICWHIEFEVKHCRNGYSTLIQALMGNVLYNLSNVQNVETNIRTFKLEGLKVHSCSNYFLKFNNSVQIILYSSENKNK